MTFASPPRRSRRNTTVATSSWAWPASGCARMQAGQVKSLKMNRGGSSISLRVEFADGSRAAFKPQQSNPQTVPRKGSCGLCPQPAAGSEPGVAGGHADAVARRDFRQARHWLALGQKAHRSRDPLRRRGQTLGSFSYWIRASPTLASTPPETSFPGPTGWGRAVSSRGQGAALGAALIAAGLRSDPEQLGSLLGRQPAGRARRQDAVLHGQRLRLSDRSRGTRAAGSI